MFACLKILKKFREIAKISFKVCNILSRKVWNSFVVAVLRGLKIMNQYISLFI